MSTTYLIFTEVKVENDWHCINPMITRRKPTDHLVVAPTFKTSASRHFEKAYRELQEDGYAIRMDEISENLRREITEWCGAEGRTELAVDYDRILKVLNASGKENCAFALRSEVAAYENGEDDIWDFVSVNEYKRMNAELKKAYQYYEWNDRFGVYRYYDEISKAVEMQLGNWITINPSEMIKDIRIILFTK